MSCVYTIDYGCGPSDQDTPSYRNCKETQMKYAQTHGGPRGPPTGNGRKENVNGTNAYTRE